MCTLKINAFSGCICGYQNLNVFILFEQGFYFFALVTQHPTMNGNDSFFTSQKGTNFTCKIIQSILMFRKDNQFFTLPGCVEHRRGFLQKMGQLVPFAVLPIGTNLVCHPFQTLQRGNFGFHLRYRTGSRCFIDDFFFGVFQLAAIVVFFDIFNVIIG